MLSKTKYALAFLLVLALSSSVVLSSLYWLGTVDHTVEVEGLDGLLFEPVFADYSTKTVATDLIDGFSRWTWTASWETGSEILPSVGLSVPDSYNAEAEYVTVSITGLPVEMSVSITGIYGAFAEDEDLYLFGSEFSIPLDTTTSIDGLKIIYNEIYVDKLLIAESDSQMLVLRFDITKGLADFGSYPLEISISLSDSS